MNNRVRKILFVNNDINRLGGIDTCFNVDVRLFSQSEYQVSTLITNKIIHKHTNTDYYYREPVKALSRFVSAFFDLRFYFACKKWISSNQPDMVIIHGYPLQIITLMIILRHLKIPFAQVIHDASFAVCPSGLILAGVPNPCTNIYSANPKKLHIWSCPNVQRSFGIPGWLWFMTYGIREILRIRIMKSFATALICPSKALATLLQDNGFTKVFHVYNSVNIPHETLPLPTTPTLLFNGRLHYTKGLKYLLQSIPNILRSIPTLKLIILGDGPERESLKRLISDLNIGSSVKLMGAIPSERVAEYINRASCVIAPSLWFENNPLAVLESLAMGRPVVASNVGGLPELVIEGQTGYLAEPANAESLATAILKTIKSLQVTEVLGKSAFDFVSKHFSHDAHLYSMIKLIDSLV